MPFSPSSHGGQLHHYTSRLTAFEHSKIGPNPSLSTVLWIGGLGDGLLTVRYPTLLSAWLPANWSLVEICLLSSLNGWGTRSLKDDVREIAQCVAYLRQLRPGQKIVLMGHSTGCQDAMEYLTGEGCGERERVDGVVLQAPVSDREGLVEDMSTEEFEGSVGLARRYEKEGRGGDVLPEKTVAMFKGTPLSARRWLSLASPDKDGDDDYFSSDLTDEQLRKTFGALRKETPLLILYSGEDQYVPKSIDKQAVVDRFTRIVKQHGGIVDEENGGIVPGATHNLRNDSDEVLQSLFRKVQGYLKRIDRDDFTSTANL